MIFSQFLRADGRSTYLVASSTTGQAVVIDPTARTAPDVLDACQRRHLHLVAQLHTNARAELEDNLRFASLLGDLGISSSRPEEEVIDGLPYGGPLVEDHDGLCFEFLGQRHAVPDGGSPADRPLAVQVGGLEVQVMRTSQVGEVAYRIGLHYLGARRRDVDLRQSA